MPFKNYIYDKQGSNWHFMYLTCISFSNHHFQLIVSVLLMSICMCIRLLLASIMSHKRLDSSDSCLTKCVSHMNDEELASWVGRMTPEEIECLHHANQIGLYLASV